MEEMKQRHVKEQRDLQALITQKKKSVSKKTRKSINSQCIDLEQRLQERHAEESAALQGDQDPQLLSEQVDEDSKVETVFESVEPQHVRRGTASPAHDVQDLSTALHKTTLVPNGNPKSQVKKPNRQKARLARRAAEQEVQIAEAAKEAEDLPDLRGIERAAMAKQFAQHGLIEQDIQPDGHCLYNSVADQLNSLRLNLPQEISQTSNLKVQRSVSYGSVREIVASFIDNHPTDFEPFMEEPITSYTDRIRNTAEWGGHLELLAIAKAYDLQLNIVQASGIVERISGDFIKSVPEDRRLWLAYYRHSYGLGEHYNSLRKRPQNNT
ncbi:MAG: hypothetical protein M1814_002220 [Vezdaea aestivalis]|nr:MAG: hypothetical protein M1814_002220 [Vezdaea aestivalis]